MNVFQGFEKIKIQTTDTEINLVSKGDGPAILLLHGYPQTHVMWHKIAPVLADQFMVVAPDLRGYGDSGKPQPNGDHNIYCKRSMAEDQIQVMNELGIESFHVVGHDRGVRVGHRMALDYPTKVMSLTSLDVVPSQAAFENMDSDLSFAWFHWHLMRQPPPFPEKLIGTNAKFYLDFLLERWTAVEDAITKEAYSEYLRCFSNPETIQASCADYRAIELDLEHDKKDKGRKLDCPVLVLWGTDMTKRPGWQTGKNLNMLATWHDRAVNVEGYGINCGHFLPEEAPEETVKTILGFLSTKFETMHH